MAAAKRSFGWGILGTGAVARQFAAQLATVVGAELRAVASGDPRNAEAFAAAFGVRRAHGSEAALLADAAVDIVYIASSAELHHRHCLMALEAGKAVLCEKPFTLTADQAREVAALAREKGLFCMEAMWMRFSPLVQQMREAVAAGALGPVALLHAEIGYRAAAARLQVARPGHGALLNFGVYGVSLAQFLFGRPCDVQAVMVPHAQGIDASVSAVLGYPDHCATIQASIVATLGNEAVVAGEAGRLRLGAPFFDPGSLQHWRSAAPSAAPGPVPGPVPGPGRGTGLLERVPYAGLLRGSVLAALLRGRATVSPRPAGAHGMRQEAEEAMRCMAEGRAESDVMPLADSIAVMETLDRIRAAGWPARRAVAERPMAGG